jgi:HrpA-like RNA helicase
MSGPTLFSKGKIIAHEFSPSQAELDKHRPIDYIMDWFGSRLQKAPTSIKDRALVLLSSTGSGKSTTVPPEFFTHFFEKSGRRNVCCTQPRVLTSQEIPKTIIQYHPELKMGVNIGFQNGVQAKRPTKGIIFMTIGVLKQQLKIMSDEDFLKRYSIIIIDEAHERSVDTDIVLLMMKRLIVRNITKQECPFLVVMSATFNPEKFANYMLPAMNDPYENIIKVSGFSHPIEETFLEYDTPDYLKAALDRAIKIHEENLQDAMPEQELKRSYKPNKDQLVIKDDAIADIIKSQKFRDILIFVSGEGDARKLVKSIQALNNDRPIFNQYPVIPIQLMGKDVTSRSENYVNITKPYSKMYVHVKGQKTVHPTRRIIVATNVAETGITIETLKYVIDTGYNKSNEYDPIYRADMLITKPVTQSMYKQRRGRVGRKAPGFAFPLYTKATFDKLQEDQFPDIIKMDTSLDLLSLIIMESDPEGESNDKPLIDLVSTKTVESKGVRKDIREKIMQNLITPTRAELSLFELKLCSADIDLFKLDLLDPPSADAMHSSLDRLYTAGAIYKNSTPTAVGVLMNKFRFIGLECIRTILAGYAWDVAIIDLITITSFCSVRQDLKMNQRDLDRLGIKTNPDESPDSLLYACDFIETLIWWYRYQAVCSAWLFDSSKESPEDWCIRNGLTHSFFNDVASAREDIILSMAGMGLNPYAMFNKSYLARTELDIDDWVAGIKQCLFEGFKSNVCMWNPIIKTYETRYGRIRTTVDKEFIANRIDLAKYGGQNPKFLLYDMLGFRQDTQTNEYKPALKYVSVLDGFIAIDVDYDV